MIGNGWAAADNRKRSIVRRHLADERQSQRVSMRDMPQHLVMRHRDVPFKGDLHDVAIRPRVLRASSSVFMFATSCVSVVLAVMVAM